MFQDVLCSAGIFVKNKKILKSEFSPCLCPQASRRVVKLPWESFLSANNALTNNFCLTLTLTSSFVGYFYVPGPLGGLKSVSGNVFGDTDSI